MSERNQYFDVVKGFGIFLVVLGHCWILSDGLGDVYILIYSFHMPLFLVVSGYLSYGKREESFFLFLKRKIRHILFPYTIFYFFSAIVSYLFFPETRNIGNMLKGYLLSDKWGAVNNFALWYLPMFFIASILFYFICKLQSRRIYAGTLILFFFIAPVFQNFLAPQQNNIPFSIHVLPAALFCMGIGYLLAELRYFDWIKTCRKINAWLCLVFFFLGIVICYHNPQQLLYITSFSYLTAAIFLLHFVFGMIDNFYGEGVNGFFILKYLGKNSLIILGLHRIILALLQRYQFQMVLDKLKINGIVSAMFVSGLVCILCVAMAKTAQFFYNKINKVLKRQYQS